MLNHFKHRDEKMDLFLTDNQGTENVAVTKNVM